MKSLRRLKNRLNLLRFFNTEYAKDFKKSVPIGDTLQIPLPQRHTVTDGVDLGYDPQALLQLKSSVTIDRVSKSHFEWDDIEAKLYMSRNKQEIRDDFVNGPMDQFAAHMDAAAGVYAGNNANNIVGVLGTDPTDLSTFAAARARMVELGTSLSTGRKGAMITPQVNVAAVNSFKGLFQDEDEISKQYREGTLGRLQGFSFAESMSLKRHTAGTWAGIVELASAVTNGASTLSLTATTGDTFKKGDKISIAGGIYAVNPMTRQITTQAQARTFTILEDVTAVASAATVSISPTIYGPGSPYQNVSALPAAGADLTLFPGTSSPNGKVGTFNLFIHSDAFAFLPIDLPVPKEGGPVEIAEKVTDPETGLSVRFVRQWDFKESKMMNRFDVVYGFGRLHSDAGAVVLLSA